MVFIHANGREIYCRARFDLCRDGGMLRTMVMSVYPLPADTPIPPHIPGQDITAEVMLHGYKPTDAGTTTSSKLTTEAAVTVQ